jgi:hypothetical protein
MGGGGFMSKSNNVIDLNERRTKQARAAEEAAQSAQGDLTPTPSKETKNVEHHVLDMTARRNDMLVDERRQVRRTLLTEFLGACVVVPQRGLQRVTIYNISENGIAFDMDVGAGRFAGGEEVAMRVYLNQFTYFPFIVRIQHIGDILDEGVIRHGTSFVKGTINDEALHHFVRFIETISASLQTDHGDIMVSNLKF